MQIQFNTDKTINGDEQHQKFFKAQIADELKRYESDITRIEVHVSDENGSKTGVNDVRCLLEARLEGKQPIAVNCHADTLALAISGATDNMKASLEKILGRHAKH